MAEPTPPVNPIICEIYESRRMFKWEWQFRFIAANGRTLGHRYNNIIDAIKAVALITNPDVPVRVRTVHRDGTEHEVGLLQ